MYSMLAYLVDLYDITPKEYKKYLLSFIQNETKGLPIRVDTIIKALENGSGTPVFPKRNYKYEGE